MHDLDTAVSEPISVIHNVVKMPVGSFQGQSLVPDSGTELTVDEPTDSQTQVHGDVLRNP